ncbi:hypothetical protein CT0861_05934, partial [Colletotrichum tofieldiae]
LVTYFFFLLLLRPSANVARLSCITCRRLQWRHDIDDDLGHNRPPQVPPPGAESHVARRSGLDWPPGRGGPPPERCVDDPVRLVQADRRGPEGTPHPREAHQVQPALPRLPAAQEERPEALRRPPQRARGAGAAYARVPRHDGPRGHVGTLVLQQPQGSPLHLAGNSHDAGHRDAGPQLHPDVALQAPPPPGVRVLEQPDRLRPHVGPRAAAARARPQREGHCHALAPHRRRRQAPVLSQGPRARQGEPHCQLPRHEGGVGGGQSGGRCRHRGVARGWRCQGGRACGGRGAEEEEVVRRLLSANHVQHDPARPYL